MFKNLFFAFALRAEWGSLQRAGGTVPNPPNVNYPSPPQYMGALSFRVVPQLDRLLILSDFSCVDDVILFGIVPGDCIHANKLGWDVLMGNLYNDYFKSRLT